MFAGHAAPVTSVAFSSTGSSILTGSDIVRLWRIADIAAGLECERDSNGLALRWKLGTLQRAENVNGPRLDVTNAASPLLISTDDPAGFFRVRAAAED